MAIMVSEGSGSNFTPHPEGQHYGVCVDVHELGVVETQFGPKQKIDIYFYCGIDKTDEQGRVVTDDNGNPVHLFVRTRFTPTLHENGSLRPFLERWRGKKFTTEELRGFDLEKLIGAPALLQIVHNENNGKVYANIDSIMKLPKGAEAPAIPDDYVRFVDRPDETEPATAAAATSPWDERDPDLPF